MKLGNSSLRISAFFIFFLITLASFSQPKELKKISEEARKCAEKGNVEQAESLYQSYVERYRQLGIAKGFQYTECLGWLAQRAAQKGQIPEAIRMQKEVVEVRKTSKDSNYSLWASAVSDLATLYSLKGDYEQAIVVGSQAVDMLKQAFGEKHHYYNIALMNLAGYYSGRGQINDYAKAIELGEASLKHMKHGTAEYAKALNALVVFYTQNGNRIEANKLVAKARKEAKRRLEEDGDSYATVLNNQAIQLSKAGNYEEAIEYAMMSKEYFERGGYHKTLAYAKMLMNLATFYSHQQKFNEAARTLETAQIVIEELVGKQHPDYLRCSSELSEIYKTIGNLERADQMAHESEATSRKLGEQNNVIYAKSLSKTAATYASNGNYQRAIEQEQKAEQIFLARKDSLSLAFSMGALANYLYANGDKELAIDKAESSLNLFRQQGERTTYFAQALNNTSILYYNNKDYAKASAYGRQALGIIRETGDTLNTVYARILANNALICFVQDSVMKAIAITQDAIKHHQRILGEQHHDNIPFLYNLSVYLMTAGRLAEAEHTYLQALQMQKEQVKTNFLHLTSQEREKFWSQKNYVFKLAPLLAYQDKGNEQILTEAYNTQLFSKGILLNSDIDFSNLLKQSGDLELLENYRRLESLRKDEEDYCKRPLGQRDNDELQKIRENIYQMERALVRGCREYGNFTKNLAIDAGQISRSLHEDEAAIEFADIYVEGAGNVYLALLLLKGRETPIFVRLFSDDDLKKLKYDGQKNFWEAMKSQAGIDSIYNDPAFGSMLWKPILKEMKGIKRLYFSPTAMFYQIGIEYLLCDDTHRITDVFQVFRLSSTKQLAIRHKFEHIKSAVVYGGLQFDMDLAQIRSQHERTATGTEYMEALKDFAFNSVTSDMSRALDSLSLRGAVHYLVGTENEANHIAEQLTMNDVDTRILMGERGTEETFKALNKEHLSLIHIATHGFSFSKEEIAKEKHSLLFIDDQRDDLENPLNYSGLLLAGANYVLKGNRIPNDLEDGILTAREIAQVDLSEVDMVVLSACQTGLGEIREDGVFGIQRGFKKAGAHALLMSLWKIDDRATNMMMTHFYEYLMEGKTRHQAFILSQECLRNEGYSSPFYWASFVLLDCYD